MTSAKSVKATEPVTLDPNFFLPPNVVDMRYRYEGEETDTALTRDDDGEIVGVEYDLVSPESSSEFDNQEAGTGTVSTVLSPPDGVTVLSQQVRVTPDGRFVVDVILDVQEVAGASHYDVRVTKI